MTKMDDQWNLKHELDRKAFETMDWLTTSLDQAKITPAQFSAGVDALFMAVSGLVEEGVIALITEASKLAEDIDTSMRRFFLKGPLLLLVTHNADTSVFKATTYDNGAVVKQQSLDFGTAAKARAKIGQLAESLCKNGYIEI